MLTDEYAEQAAREKLGLVKENEIVFQGGEVRFWEKRSLEVSDDIFFNMVVFV